MTGLPLVGDEFAGYRTRSVLGRGGMSVVYQAENLRLSSIIALKVLAPELAANDVFRARFLEESRIAASLNHPNVIPIYDMGSSDDLLYIAMRYVSGTDLRQMIKKRGRLTPETALFLLGQTARALDTAHHRASCTGRQARQHADREGPDAAIIWAHVEETPARPTELRPELPPQIDAVFGRVLAKQPSERYGSCREFIDAAWMALGISGAGAQSSHARLPTAINPSAAATPGSRAGPLPDRYSWSNPASPGTASRARALPDTRTTSSGRTSATASPSSPTARPPGTTSSSTVRAGSTWSGPRTTAT